MVDCLGFRAAGFITIEFAEPGERRRFGRLVSHRHDAGAEPPNGFEQFLMRGRDFPAHSLGHDFTECPEERGRDQPGIDGVVHLAAALGAGDIRGPIDCSPGRSASAYAADGSRSWRPTMMRASGSAKRKSIPWTTAGARDPSS